MWPSMTSEVIFHFMEVFLFLMLAFIKIGLVMNVLIKKVEIPYLSTNIVI